VAAAVDQIGSNAIIVLIVALLAMTTEFRHGTIGRTLQLTPSRSAVLTAKLAVGVVYAVAFFVAASILVVALVLLLGDDRRRRVDRARARGRHGAWQGLVGLSLNALLGVAVGALIRSQVVAITVLLVWLFVVENLVRGVLARDRPVDAVPGPERPVPVATRSRGTWDRDGLAPRRAGRPRDVPRLRARRDRHRRDPAPDPGRVSAGASGGRGVEAVEERGRHRPVHRRVRRARRSGRVLGSRSIAVHSSRLAAAWACTRSSA
jgi:hypothetical protein